MNLPTQPNPFPTLREGLALGAREHSGFVNVWNWLCGIMKKAKDYFILGINDRTGNVNVVAGEGINVTTEGNTIMISIGSGKNTDNDNGNGGSGGGNSGGGGGGSGSGGGNGSGGGSGDGGESGDGWINTPLPAAPTEPSTQCNDWSEGIENDWGDGAPENEGDNCKELNGW